MLLYPDLREGLSTLLKKNFILAHLWVLKIYGKRLKMYTYSIVVSLVSADHLNEA